MLRPLFIALQFQKQFANCCGRGSIEIACGLVGQQ